MSASRVVTSTIVSLTLLVFTANASTLQKEVRKIATERKRLNQQQLDVIEEIKTLPKLASNKVTELTKQAKSIRDKVQSTSDSPSGISVKRVRHAWRSTSREYGVIDFKIYYSIANQIHTKQTFEFISKQMKQRKHIAKSEIVNIEKMQDGYDTVMLLRFVDLPPQAIM